MTDSDGSSLLFTTNLMITASRPTIGRHHVTSAKAVMDHFRRHHRRVILTVNTSYLSPNDFGDGSRYTATEASSDRFTFVHADYSLTTAENHLAAAMALITEHCYGDYTLMAYEPDRASGYVFTFEAEAI